MDPIQHDDSPSVVEPKPKKATKPKAKKETAAEKKARHARRPYSFLIMKARKSLKRAWRSGRTSAVQKAAAKLASLLQKR